MKNYFLKQADYFNNKLSEYMIIVDNPQKIIYEAMSYSLLAGGKRLRPILMSEVCKMLGGVADDVIPFAAALEMIHTYSLIHDDLPAMDNDDLRRGKPTSHVKFGEANAILAGDALLTKAFETMSNVNKLPSATVLKVINIIASASGADGMIGGQVVDIECEHKSVQLSELRYIHSLKTGAIIKAACLSGAVIANADNKSLKAVEEFAVNLGIAFQIQDDILDVSGSEEKLGKPIGSDAESEKNTYVSLCGIDEAHRLMIKHSELAKQSLDIFGEKADFLKWLISFLTSRES